MTPKTPPDPKLVAFYDAEAETYLKSLPLSHFMESTTQATQREITLESFAVIRAMRPDVQCFNELLIQCTRHQRKARGKVVPDNFVVVHPEPIEATGNFSMESQPARPLLVLEYVSKYSLRKDHDDNYDKYEADLKVPYYLIFYLDNEELSLFHLVEEKYVAVRPNAAGRVAIPELELEAALLGGWVRFWFRGELLPLPGDLLIERDAAREQRDDARGERDAAREQRDAERAARQAAETRATSAEAELTKLREELAKARGQS